jgi:hypothetical protein
MNNILDIVHSLEDQNDFETSFLTYKKEFHSDKLDFQLWRSFYFFLWYCLFEEVCLDCEKFNLKYSLRQEYDLILNYGHRTYSDIPEFNFIVGYTISVYPYIFSDILESKSTAIQLIKKAWNLERSNLIYEMVRIGDLFPGSKEYQKLCIQASTLVLTQYKGKGYLNTYFRSVLFRI